MKNWLAALAICAMIMPILPTLAQEGGIRPAEWDAYRQAFVLENGRVVDTYNGNISHTESQGYGLLLAYLASDPASFERIWSFTRTELMVRDDGLFAWKWAPDVEPHVTDINNATDGDILITYALALAGRDWNDAGKTEVAVKLARDIAKATFAKSRAADIMLPAAQGFAEADRADGPIVNPSYWVFEALPVLDALAPEAGWAAVSASGLDIIAGASANRAGLPPDWVSLHALRPAPARGYDPEFAYNNIRVPLYLLRAGIADAQLLEGFAKAFALNGPARTNVETGAVVEAFSEPGYAIIAAALACTLNDTAIPADLQTFAPMSYYGSTLHLLTLDYLRRERSQCLGEAGQ